MIIPVGYAQVNLIWTGTPIPTGAQMTFGVNNTVNNASASDIAAAVRDQWDTCGIQSRYDPLLSVSSILVKKGPNSTGASFVLPTTLPGSTTSPVVSPNVAALIKKNTAAGGRTGRGRMYMPGIPEGQVNSDGVMVSAFREAITNELGTFRLGLETAGIPMALLHGAGSPVSTPIAITGLVCDTKVATQRRRLRR